MGCEAGFRLITLVRVTEGGFGIQRNVKEMLMLRWARTDYIYIYIQHHIVDLYPYAYI